MKAQFKDSEKLYRGIKKVPTLIKKDGTITRAAFTYTGKKSNGCSVSRQMNRSNQEAIQHTILCLNGHADYVASISVKEARNVDIYIKYSPSENNYFHSELYADKDENKLNDEQLDFLAANARVENYYS